MNLIVKSTIALIAMMTAASCQPTADERTPEAQSEQPENNETTFRISGVQLKALDIKIDSLRMRNLSSAVRANGQLEVPPQNEATVTSSIGANVTSIHVIEGDDVVKGQVLAYLSHPNLTRLQSDYLEAYNRLQFLEKEFDRQKRLYEEEVGSGKTFQQTQADYRTAEAMVRSLGLQMRQMGIDPSRIQHGELYERVPVRSPIDGSVVKVEVNTAQYVPPEQNLFQIVNTHHIHADLMVFEKDVHKVKVGQRVRFRVETLPNEELFAEIYSVGKKFESAPKAIHVHADIENKTGHLIPGMYITGQILTGSDEGYALPEEAITRDEGKSFAFIAKQSDEAQWLFEPIEVIPGVTSDGWVAVRFLEPPPTGALFALNNGYYLSAEWKKGELEDRH